MNKFIKKLILVGMLFVGTASVYAMTAQKYRELQGDVSEQDALGIAIVDSAEVQRPEAAREAVFARNYVRDYNAGLNDDMALQMAKVINPVEAVSAQDGAFGSQSREIQPMQIYNTLAENDAWLVDELIEACDKFYAENVRFGMNSQGYKIMQIPCLYQAYPEMPENYCGYYAAYFALCMVEWNCAGINNRKLFDMYLSQWKSMLSGFDASGFGALSLDNLGPDRIGMLLNRLELYNVLVDGWNFKKSDFSKSLQSGSRLLGAIQSFKNQEPGYEKLCFILNTRNGDGSHWIAVLAQYGGLIIVDSMATNRTNCDYVIDLYKTLYE